MLIYTLQNLIELHRKELNLLVEAKNFNLQDPEVIQKSTQLDKLIVTFMTLLIYFKILIRLHT